MQIKNILAAAAAAGLSMVAVGNAQATTISPAPTFQVTMTITSACAVTTAPGNINLGSFVAQSAAISQSTGNSTTFKVNCSKGTSFNVGLAPSSGNGGTANGTGNMKGAASGNADLVPYALYQDSGLTTAWGNTTGTNTESGTGNGMASGKAISFTAYAQATSADFTPDTYSDTVTVNVNY